MENNDKNKLNWIGIGQRFRNLRLNKGLNQLEIIDKAKAFNGSISMFEKGIQPASTHYALFLRNEFGASFDWLYDGSEAKIKSSDREKKRSLNPIEIGKRLRKFRKDEGLTLKEFGEWTGLPISTISTYEIGRSAPEIKTALKIKRALNKPLDWLYFEDEEIIPNSRKKGRRLPTKLNLNQINRRYLQGKSKERYKCWRQLFTTF
ncbi:helix-turn-helix transcriptional regulator [Candidatus Liberibacter africanus]|uniref:HTH cro/C1-type domain-containing protein n=1 Tax=Candidatus Liberibacter africanus PTSAPSY TaxID=1277257 RepID=A0A0G3I3Z2_LIBAF|nr:helix-turn-helix transcriptional regulator [Candidatus Liberibacter africanus]AKK20606.1 hypothetical protein G293_04955 [Candidatus Liberibacter africanus PTSAPSY]QTP64291.1 helix-turn-helix transcriptional regulator [Candidatus Liberibacter africanus]